MRVLMMGEKGGVYCSGLFGLENCSDIWKNSHCALREGQKSFPKPSHTRLVLRSLRGITGKVLAEGLEEKIWGGH